METLTKEEVNNIVNTLNVMSGFEFPNKIQYIIGRNLILLKKANKDYTEEKKTAINSYVQKDKKGVIMVKDNEYVFKDVSTREKYLETIRALADEKVEVSFYQMAYAEFERMIEEVNTRVTTDGYKGDEKKIIVPGNLLQNVLGYIFTFE